MLVIQTEGSTLGIRLKPKKYFTKSECEMRIREWLSDMVPVSIAKQEIRPYHKVIDDLGLDSLDTVEMAMFLEEEFGIEISDKELGRLSTVNSVYKIVWEKLENAHRSKQLPQNSEG